MGDVPTDKCKVPPAFRCAIERAGLPLEALLRQACLSVPALVRHGSLLRRRRCGRYSRSTPVRRGIRLDDTIKYDCELIPLSARHLPPSTFDMLEEGTCIRPNEPALSFFLNAKTFKRPSVWSHDQFIRCIRQAANAFRRLGIGRSDVIAYVLPNLPETHFVIWGGEAADVVMEC